MVTRMRVYLDTEFADWDDPNTALISIGMVTSDGREFYAESTDFDPRRCTRFVQRIVLPQMGSASARQLDTQKLRAAVLDWLTTIPEPEIVFDYDGDWQLLARLLGETMPKGIRCRNICTQIDKLNLETYFQTNGVPKHHALNDARALRVADIKA